ncbi:hypothetical protein N1851_003943 [Merluccius polli]|uniref:Uncharacterized protein n=1 Tax=Merluccius polli TaxID=89951 RepID=A0AA47P7P2_MERPO|nr:hypothetical protein N1851_003943 [Merluccius polli]
MAFHTSRPLDTRPDPSPTGPEGTRRAGSGSDSVTHTYSRRTLFKIGNHFIHKPNPAFTKVLHDLGLLRRPASTPTPTTAAHPQRKRRMSASTPTPTAAAHPQRKRRRRCTRRQKRGKCGGIQARLAANPHKPALPSIVLANVRSLDNKLDELHLLRSSQQTVRECCVFVFTETWLNNNIPDSAIQLDRLTCYRADRALIN